MGPVLLGAAALVLLLFLAGALANADPKLLVRLVRYTAAAVLGLFTLLLAVTGRLGVAFFLGSMAWGLATGGHLWPGGWPHFPGTGGHSRPSSGSTSVRGSWVEMQLDHETGEM